MAGSCERTRSGGFVRVDGGWMKVCGQQKVNIHEYFLSVALALTLSYQGPDPPSLLQEDSGSQPGGRDPPNRSEDKSEGS